MRAESIDGGCERPEFAGDRSRDLKRECAVAGDLQNEVERFEGDRTKLLVQRECDLNTATRFDAKTFVRCPFQSDIKLAFDIGAREQTADKTVAVTRADL